MVLPAEFQIEDVDFLCVRVTAVHPAINNRLLTPLMSAPPIPRSGRRNYRDRAKCHQEFAKSHRATSRGLPFFFLSPHLPLSINSAHRLSSAISLQTISPRRRGLELLRRGLLAKQRTGARMSTRSAGHFCPKRSQKSQGRLGRAGDGETLLAKESEQN